MAEDFKPTPAERLTAFRRRSGKTQVQMAEELHLPLHIYGEIERGVVSVDESLLKLSGIELTVPEEITARRRRLGLTQKRLAQELGVCRMTAAAMEEGRIDPSRMLELLRDKGRE